MSTSMVAADGGPSQLYMPVPLQEGKNYVSANVGNIISSIMIDNITPSWLFISAANRYVPPLTWGVVFQATNNSRDGTCLWQTPPGQIAPSTLNAGTAQVIFTDQFIPPSSGVSLLTPNQPIHLNTFPGPFVGSPKSFIVTPPPGTNSLIVVTSNSVGFQIAGNTSNQFYVNDATVRANGVVFCPVDMGTDTSYTITISFTGTLGTVYVDASYVVQAVAIENVPLSTNLTQINGSPIPASGDIPVNLDRVAGVSVLTNNVANPYRSLVSGSQIQEQVFQRPTFHIVTSNAGIATTGSIIIAAPGAGLGIVIRKIWFSVQTAPTVAAGIEIGTAASDFTLGLVRIPIPVAATPEDDVLGPLVYDDYLIGTNVPLEMTALGQAIAGDVTVTYGVVTAANWPQE